jgi:carboxyl-terminal processing protease
MKKVIARTYRFIFLAIPLVILLPQTVLAVKDPDLFEKVFALAMKNYVEAPDPAALAAGAVQEMRALLKAKKIDSKADDAGVAPRSSDDAIKQVARFYSEALGSGGIAPQELEVAAIKGMLKALDPQASYLSARELQDLAAEMKGTYSGVGMQTADRNEQLIVVAPLDGSPAYRAGIQAGDIVLKVDQVPVKGMSQKSTTDRMRGEKGTTVTLTIARPSFEDPYDVPLVRDTVVIQSVRYRMLGDATGYIKIGLFQNQTPNEVEAALRDLAAKGMKKLVLDLRSNPGGPLDPAIAVSGKFLSLSSLAVTLQGRERADRKEFRTATTPVFVDRPMIVLIDKGTASGAELLAGALRDHKRAVLVGARSFGSGAIQSLFALGDGSALRLTTARYYTPENISVEKTGIVPEVEVVEQESEDVPLKVAQAALKAYGETGFSYARLLQIASGLANSRRAEFEKAKAENTYESYEGFLRSYPYAPEHRQAMQAIVALIELQRSPYEGYRTFVLAYDDALEFVPPRYRLALIGPEGLMVGDIIELRKRGVADNVLAAKIRSGRGRYRDFSSDDIDELKKMGVPGAAVEAMIETTRQVNRAVEEEKRKKNLESLRAEIQRLQKRTEELKSAQARHPAAPAPVAAGTGQVQPQGQGPSESDLVKNCAAQISALEKCMSLPRLGATLCRSAAKIQFPCE